ncbi:MAG TPA: glycerol-3-phosphate 1-O-acyltransferase PlsY [Gammaproteobacteria bacterium]|nr:glycerol-3-phosphate 1-O-acyltransferase PlsY [Gammaproteobacteria bacterium]
MFYLDTSLAVVIAYLIGSLSSAIILCKLLGLPDPRTQGSGNPGATNVLRFGGKKVAVLTLLGDVFKGVIPVLIAREYGLDTLGVALVALAAFLGHLYPIFFRFQGGKGVATAFGCLVALSLPLGLALLLTWLIIAIVFRYSSLAALITALAAPVYAWYFTNEMNTWVACAISLLLIYRHHRNIYNLLTGKEDKIGKKL